MLFMARVLWIRLYKTIVWMSSVLQRRPADAQFISATTLTEERGGKRPHQVMTSLEDLCRPLWMAKTVKLQHTRSALLRYSASCQPVHFFVVAFFFLPFAELTFGVGHDHVAETRSRAELLPQQLDVLREDVGALLGAQGEKAEPSPERLDAGAAGAQAHLDVLRIGRLLLLQQLHQRFVLVDLSQADPATRSV